MRKALYSLLTLLLLSGCTSSDGKTPVPQYTIRDSHPRIYLNHERVKEIRKRCADRGNAQAKYYRVLKEFGDNYVPGKTEGSISNCLSLAFLYSIGEVEGNDYSKRSVVEYGRLGADMLTKIRPPDQDLDYFKRYTPAFIACYDWLFPALTPDQRAKVFENYIAVADKMREVLNKVIEGRFRGARETYGYYGLAFYGDGKYIYPKNPSAAAAADRKAKEYTDFFVSWHRDQSLAILESAAKGGAYSSGTMYGEAPYPGRLWALDAWETASTDDLYGKTTTISGYPLFWLYQMIPYRTHVRYDNANGRTDQPGGLVRFGDYRYLGYTAVGSPTINIAQAQGIANRQGKADLAAVFNWLIQYHGDFTIVPHGGPFPVNKWVGAGPPLVWDILFREGRVEAQSPAKAGLPLAHYFGSTDTGPPLQPDFPTGRPEGAGIVAMRSSWDDPGGTLVWFKASSHELIHGHRDQGSLQIYRKGWLAIDSGQYEETSHRGNYTLGAVAHNTLLVYRPGESRDKKKTDPIWFGYANDGGMRAAGAPSTAADTRDADHFIGGISKFESVPGVYDYTHADITRAYNSVYVTSEGQNSKVSRVTRSIFFLRPDEYVIVFDQITSTKPEYPKRWLLHSVYRPELNGVEVFEGAIPYSKNIPGKPDGVRLRGSKRGGISQSTDTSLVTLRGWDFGPSDGRLVMRTLLPDKHITRVVGGSDSKGIRKTTLSRPYSGGGAIFVQSVDGFEAGDFVYLGGTSEAYSKGSWGSPNWPVDDTCYRGWGKIQKVDRLNKSVTLFPYRYGLPNLPEGTDVLRSDHANANAFEFMDAEYNQWEMHGESVANAGPYAMQHGNWRVEVEPIEKRAEDVFLHVMLPCDKDTQSQSQALLKEKVKMTRSGNDIFLEIVGKARTYKIGLKADSPDGHVTIVERGKTILDNSLSRSAIKTRARR